MASSAKGNTTPKSISACHFYRDEQSNDLIYCTVCDLAFSLLLSGVHIPRVLVNSSDQTSRSWGCWDKANTFSNHFRLRDP